MHNWPMYRLCQLLFLTAFFTIFFAHTSHAKPVSEAVIKAQVMAPYALGKPTEIDGVWELLSGSGLQEGFVIQTELVVPLPGFGGQPINLMVMMDLEGTLIGVKNLTQNEPIFVSGLGEAPFLQFIEQYQGVSIKSPVTVGTNYGAASGGNTLYLDGVSKATASVRIAHESIIAAAREVAQKKLTGLVVKQSSATPKLDYNIKLTWLDLVQRGIAKHVTVTHGQVRELYEGTLWHYDDPFPERANSDAFIDLWIVDIGPPSIARAALSKKMLAELETLRATAPHDEAILLIEAGDHGLVPDDFVRNTSPSWILARQDGLPIALRDADLLIDLRPDLPEGKAMVLRADRRLGFDPVRAWDLIFLTIREHGIFKPELGQLELVWSYQANPEFYNFVKAQEPLTPWQSALVARKTDIILLTIVLTVGILALLFQPYLVRLRSFKALRLSYLAIVLGFVGWWGQGQLSIVTPLAVLQAISVGKSLSFLLYDPFSLLIWGSTLVSFFLWGRAFFCGWLCPFGAMQEFVQKLGYWCKIKPWRVSTFWDLRLKYGKYISLALLFILALWLPDKLEKAVEIEPFKTSISIIFMREWFYVLYAILCLGISLFIAKGFCRYLCPLGALMALGGMMQLRGWITRRTECGSPCQLCRKKCLYDAIAPDGAIAYSECLGCLDCVDIFHDPMKCAPLILRDKKQRKTV